MTYKRKDRYTLIVNFLKKLIRPVNMRISLTGKLLIAFSFIIFLIFASAFLASEFLNMTFREGLWWAWTRLIDSGFSDDDDDSSINMILSSVMFFLSVLIYAGVFITIFTEALENMVSFFKKGRIPKKLSGHTVIASNDTQTKHYIEAVKTLSSHSEKDSFLVVISEQQYFEQTRENSLKQTLIAIFHIWTMEAINRLQLKNAKRIILLGNFGGDMSQILKLITQLNSIRSLDNPKEELKLYIEVNNRLLLPQLQMAIRRFVSNEAKIEICLMNMENTSARLALLNYPLDGVVRIEKQSAQITFIIQGWSTFAEALLQQVLRVGHYYCAFRIVIATDNTFAMQEKINHDYPGISGTDYTKRVVNIECIDIESIHSLEVQSEDIVTLAICGENSDDVFIQAMQASISNMTGLMQVLAELPDDSGYRDVFNEINQTEGEAPVFPVDSHVAAFELMEQLDEFAQKGHEKYIKAREVEDKRSIKADGSYENPADYPWELLDETNRNWNRSPADHALIKLNALADKYQIERYRKVSIGQISLTNDLKKKVADIICSFGKKILNNDMELLAGLEHDRWSGEKLSEGWHFGQETDKKNKISSFLIPYRALSDEVKQYDREQVVAQLTNLFDN